MIITADKNGTADSVYHTLNGKLGDKYPIVLVSWVENFVFNEALLNLKDYVLICFCEYGYDFDLNKSGSHIWGVNSEKFKRYYNNDWVKFDNWVKQNPFKILLKRELLKRDVTPTAQPIEYPCIVDEWPIQSEEEFNSRLVNVFEYWGRSNEMRVRIHGQILMHSYEKGFQVCDNIYYIPYYLAEEKGEKWITLWIPHYTRVHISELLKINNVSKLSLSWAGAGFKCFRSAEAAVNSVMVMNRNNFAWTFDWNDTNCILVTQGQEIEGIERALRNPDLYKIYKAGVENNKKYMLPNYTNHLESLINNA